MWLPSYDVFDAIYAGTPGVGHYFVPPIDPDPRLWKYTFRIWTRSSAWEGAAFFKHAPIYCMADYSKLEDSLITAGEHFFVYCIQRPRLGSSAEQNLPHWPRMVFATAYEDDSDPIWHGHK